MHPIFSTPPREETLGVPVPPGSVYSPELSAFYSGYSVEHGVRYAFELAADFAAILRFFERATGNEAIPSPQSRLVARIPIGSHRTAGGDEHEPEEEYVMVQRTVDSREVRIVICRDR